MLDAKTFATSGEGSSGRYVDGLIERLGIADQVKPKISSGGPGTSAKMLSHGEVDFVVSGLPPLIGTPNIEWLGYLPDEINHWLVFSGGIGTHAKEPDAGRALLKFLTSPAACRGVQRERPGAGSIAMPLIVRPARADDLDRANALVVGSMNDLSVRHGFGPMASVRPPVFLQFSLRDDPDGLWIAEDAGEILGFAFSWVCGELWFLAQLFVAPGEQGRGIGQELLRRTWQHAETAGATNKALITFTFNTVSQGLISDTA